MKTYALIVKNIPIAHRIYAGGDSLDRKKTYLSQWASKSQLPTIHGPGQVLIEITGNCRVLIENHKGVVAYTKELIQIRSADGMICVDGSGLLLDCMSRFQLVITGRIDRVTMNAKDGC